MRSLAALALLLAAATAAASTAYVSDELVLGVYSEQNGQGQRLATLHSGTGVETLTVSGEFTQVRLSDGSSGWVKSAYLTTQVPATVRVKQLEEELDRSRATTPQLAEAAARSEVLQLQRLLASSQSELAAARAAAKEAPVTTDGAGADAPRAGLRAGITAAAAGSGWALFLALLLVLACGFWSGYAFLARRIKRKFGGIKVY